MTTEIYVGIGFLILISIIGIIMFFMYLFKRIRNVEERNAELKHVEEHTIKMSDLIVQNNQFIASKLKYLENQIIILKDEVNKLRGRLGD